MQIDYHAASATIDGDYELGRPSVWLRFLYAATLLTTFFTVALIASSGWIELILGTSLLRPFVITGVPVVLWRLYVVWQYPTTLMRARSAGVLTLLRGTAIAMMAVGCFAPLALALQDPAIAALGGVRSDSGIENIALQLAALRFGSIGLQGLLIFEWTRLIGLEDVYRRAATTEMPRREPEPVVWLNVVALSMLLVLQVLGTVAAMTREAAASSYRLLGVVIALPTALLIVVRTASLFRHRQEIPLPESTGVLNTVRVLSLTGLVVYVLAAVASLIGGTLQSDSALIGEAVSVLVSSHAMLFGLASLVALEGSRLLTYERCEQPDWGRAKT